MRRDGRSTRANRALGARGQRRRLGRGARQLEPHDGDRRVVRGNRSIGFPGRGGGPGGVNAAYGVPTLARTRVRGNRAANGGGVAGERLIIRRSTITANRAGAFGGAIAVDSYGRLTLALSTVSGNRAGKGGGGIASNDRARLTSANRAARLRGRTVRPPARINSRGYNIDDGHSCRLDRRTDQVRTDPRLRPLADYGGPTLTHALRLSSPAVDRGISGGAPADQRGAPRTHAFPGIRNARRGDGGDVGSFELQRAARD